MGISELSNRFVAVNHLREMDDFLGYGILALAGIVMAIIALSKLAHLSAGIEELKRRLSKLEGRDEIPAPQPIATKSASPPPLPGYVTKPQTAAPPAATQAAAIPVQPHHTFNWESILGVKLFAWIGGFALFLGVVFLVKYAFDNNWITPTMRIVAGAIIGVALIAVSLLPKVRRYSVPAQSVCAAGILILYADIYTAQAFYHLISLTATTALMWIVTAIALGLAYSLAAQSVAWLAIAGGFVTPFLLDTSYTNPVLFVTYIGVLDCGVAAIARLKRWTYLLSVAAFLSVLLLAARASGAFSPWSEPTGSHLLYLVIEGLFLCLCVAVTWQKELDNWTVVAMGIAGLGALIGITAARIFHPIDLMLWLLLGNAGIIAFFSATRRFVKTEVALAAITVLAFLGTCFVEWLWCNDVLNSWGNTHGLLLNLDRDAAEIHAHIALIIFRHVAIFLLYAAVPYLVGTKRVWPWMLAAVAAPIHFAFVYAYLESPAQLLSHELFWLVPLLFAVPAAIGVWYLVKKEHVELASGDTRLATQAAAVLALISFVFPVQFQSRMDHARLGN